MGAPDPQVDARAVKLDRVATTLIGAVAAVGGLLAVYGVSSDRINLLLDDDQAKSFLVAAGVCAVLAVCASLFALMARRSEWEVGWLVLGSAGYVAGLLCSLFAAAGAANSPGRPAVTAVEIRPGPPSLLTVSVRSSRLDEHDRLAVQLVHSSSGSPSTPRPCSRTATVASSSS